MATENKTSTKVKREKRVYKGEDVEAQALVGCQDVPVEVPDRAIPRQGQGWEAFGGNSFPASRMIVMSVIESGYNDGSLYVLYRPDPGKGISEFREERLRVPKNFKFRILTGTVGQALRERHDQFVLKNLSRQLGSIASIGSDPEIFVENEKGEVIPAFLFLGSKKEPNRTRGEADGNKPVYWDGFQAEFETAAPSCLAYQVDSVQLGLRAVWEFAQKFDKSARLSTRTVVEIPQEILETAKEEHVTFGCMPSRNAYGLKGAHVPPRELPVRFAGGHIHFGIGKTEPEKAVPMVKALDAILGVACVALFENFDNPVRRKFYGLPGEYRLPPHGIEYRVLSNAWLYHPLMMNFVFDLGRKALLMGQKGYLRFWKGTEAETIECIQTCNAKLAREILERNKPVFMQLLSAPYVGMHWGRPEAIERIFQVYMHGMESVVANPSDLVKNWNLDGHWVTHSDGRGKSWRYAYEMVERGEKV